MATPARRLVAAANVADAVILCRASASDARARCRLSVVERPAWPILARVVDGRDLEDTRMADDPVPARFELDPSLRHHHDGETVSMDLVGDMVRVDPGSGMVSGLYRCPRCATDVTLDVAGAAGPKTPGADVGPGHVDWDMRGVE